MHFPFDVRQPLVVLSEHGMEPGTFIYYVESKGHPKRPCLVVLADSRVVDVHARQA